MPSTLGVVESAKCHHVYCNIRTLKRPQHPCILANPYPGERRASKGELVRASPETGDLEPDSVSAEFSKRLDPERIQMAYKRLDLAWNVSSRKKRNPGQCACCGGGGNATCAYCRGSGALTLGEHVFCSVEGGCKTCPVCNGKGNVKCEHCIGTGFRASWMEDPVCSVDSDQ